MLRNNNIFKLLVIAHANRGPGASSTGINLLRALNTIDYKLDLIPVLPVGCGYEKVVETYSLPAIWFDQRGSYARRLFFDAVTLPRIIRRAKPHAILALGNIGVLNPRVPQAILVQDAHYVYPRRYFGRMTAMQHLRYFIQKRQLRTCMRNSSILYCQTATMLRHIEKTFGKPRRSKVISKVIASEVVDGQSHTEMPPEFKPFQNRIRMFCLTRYYPHKNLEAIVETFIHARTALRNVVVFITITETQHPNAKCLLDKIHRSGLSDHIVNLGPVEQNQIPHFFKNCHALLFPTLLESFSATYLEAMQLDLPILTSDLDFAHDICGPAAFYFNPWSVESIADAIIRIQNDTGLRTRLATNGRDRIKTVYSQSWNDIVRAIVSDLHNLVFDKEIKSIGC